MNTNSDSNKDKLCIFGKNVFKFYKSWNYTTFRSRVIKTYQKLSLLLSLISVCYVGFILIGFFLPGEVGYLFHEKTETLLHVLCPSLQQLLLPKPPVCFSLVTVYQKQDLFWDYMI